MSFSTKLVALLQSKLAAKQRPGTNKTAAIKPAIDCLKAQLKLNIQRQFTRKYLLSIIV